MEWSKALYQSVSKPSVKLCRYFGITANQVTLFNHFITLTFGCWFFAQGEYLYGLMGLGVCLINGFLDYLDGDVARETHALGEFGSWLDSGFDVIIQNAVMGAISIGCFNMGMPVYWIALFFISNTANNFVSFNYNARFGFDSDKGNELFRSYMNRKDTFWNKVIKNIIDPTTSHKSLILFTYRYWIALGLVTNTMPICFMIMTIIGNIKWFVMFVIYALYLRGDKNIHVLMALSVLDEERAEFYKIRYK